MNLNDICQGCGGYPDQPILKLFNDKTFKITDGSYSGEDFDLSDFAFPVDGHTCMGLTLTLTSGYTTLFDNEITALSPTPVLESGKQYARGILLKVTYPAKNNNGEDVNYVEKSVKLKLTTSDTLTSTEYPLHNFFAIFTNAKTNNISELINKIEILNPNSDYSIRISALILLGTAE